MHSVAFQTKFLEWFAFGLADSKANAGICSGSEFIRHQFNLKERTGRSELSHVILVGLGVV